MAVTRFLARMLSIDISTGAGTDTISGTADDTWTPINGLNSLTHSDSSVDADTTGFDSDGHEESMVAQRGESWTLAGFKLLDTATGDQDPGQQAVEELAREIGPDSVGYFRLTYPGGGTEIFAGTAKFTKPGGGNNDPAAWSVALKVTGAPTYAAAP